MTREDWLLRLSEQMATWFDDLGCPLPPVRMAIGFPSTGKRGRRIGECWDSSASEDSTHEILIRPDRADPLDVAAILAHELVHAAVGIPAGHGPRFAKVAKAIGLEGKMTATVPGKRFVAAVEPMLASLGALPHARLGIGNSTGPKKQSTRLLKAACGSCGYTVRIARKWVADVGSPHCPQHGEMLVDLPESDEGGA